MAIEVKPLTGGLGAEIIGADVRDPAQFNAIFKAFVDHSVIAIRDQHITPDDQIAFAEFYFFAVCGFHFDFSFMNIKSLFFGGFPVESFDGAFPGIPPVHAQFLEFFL